MFKNMFKKKYLFIIPFYLVISESHACYPTGHLVFYNNSFSTLNVMLRRVPSSEIVCLVKARNEWTEKEEKVCSKERTYSYESIAIGPRSHTQNICWSKGKGSGRWRWLESFEVTYKHLGRKHKGPVGIFNQHFLSKHDSRFHYYLSAHTMHRGDQTLIKSKGCEHQLPYTPCHIKFDMSTKG